MVYGDKNTELVASTWGVVGLDLEDRAEHARERTTPCMMINKSSKSRLDSAAASVGLEGGKWQLVAKST